MAGGNLSPRQKMINMMYLVLTALLALNVSKEVLNSFFEVNKGIERTTNNFSLKNSEVYAEFDNAATNNPEKYEEVRNKVYSLKSEADSIILFLQEMKDQLVQATDAGKVCLGNPLDVLDEEGKPKEGSLIENKNFSDLNSSQKLLPIAYLNAKSNREASGSLFLDKKKTKENQTAYILSRLIKEYEYKLVEAAEGNDNLVKTIKQVCNVDDKKSKKKSIPWAEYNFYDMPSVGALTILSKIQSDMRNLEADVIAYLKKNIDAKSLKFTSAQGIQIPQSNFVLKGDSFRAQIFITANNPDQNPDIYVGEVDSIGEGEYQMRGVEGVDYETVKVVNGKGMFSKRVRSEGNKKWGGLISMKTESGTKFYPFAGEYLVAAKTVVVSPIKMNILYTGLEAIGGNPIQVSVPGHPASEITPVISNGTLKVENKSEGIYSAFPTVGKTSAVVSLYVNIEGKRTKMGEVEFRVRKTPPPAPVVRDVDANGLCDRSTLKNAIVQATLENFLFDGLKYKVTSFKLSGSYKGAPASDEQKNGMGFTTKMKGIIANSASGSTINITKIRAQLIGSNRPSEAVKGDLVIEIK